MSRYRATIRHHSISRQREIDVAVNVGDTLRAAKLNATREFGVGYPEFEIIITDTTRPRGIQTVASRKVAGKWSTYV